MKSEYVGLTHPEKVYVEKNILQAELELLDSIKRLRAFKKLRTEELVFKIALKRRIGEVLDDLKTLDRILPKVAYVGKGEEGEEVEEVSKEELSLSKEIEEIRKKLAKLS